MKSMVNRIKTIVMAMVVSATFTINVAAESNQNSNSFNDYLTTCIPRYLYAQGIDVGDTICYSEPIVLYDFSSFELIGSVVFVINENEVIGKMMIYDGTDGYTSVFDQSISYDIQDAFNNNSNIALGYMGDTLLCFTSANGYKYVDGIVQSNFPTEQPGKLSIPKVSGSIRTDFPMLYSTSCSLKNTLVHEGNSNKHDPDGQCWASCVAMKLNYQLSLNLTSDKIYEDLVDEKKTTESAFKHYEYEYTKVKDAMAPRDVYALIRSDIPVIACIKHDLNDDDPNNDINKHAIVICGVYMETTMTTYTVDNPNSRSKQSMITHGLPDTVVNSMTIGTKDRYNNWYRTFY